ncbi:MAG: right-handed parallel beta-helix repeat-containing protein [Aureispira sp.]
MMRLASLPFIYGIFFLLTFSACDMDSSKDCQQEIISDPSYFTVDRVLTNTCTKQQGIDYILTGNHTYTISANTFIEAGTIIEVEDSAALLIESTGTLQAVGTSAEPVIIRGYHKSTSNWRGLYVRSSSSFNQLHQVHIENAGGIPLDGETAQGAIVVLDQGKIAISSSRIASSATYGINLASTTANLSKLENSTITGNSMPMHLYTTQASAITTGNNLRGNVSDYIAFSIAPFINEAYNWPMLNIPYRLMSADSSSTAIQSLSGTASLTIEPGCILEMLPQTGFNVSDLSKLSVIGTASAPIVFTGTIKNYSTWNGFEFRFTQMDNRFEHVRIEHAGDRGGIMYMWGDPKLTLDNVEFTYSSSCAFYDAPKTSSQSINSNLFFRNITYDFINSQYCKGS